MWRLHGSINTPLLLRSARRRIDDGTLTDQSDSLSEPWRTPLPGRSKAFKRDSGDSLLGMFPGLMASPVTGSAEQKR